MLHRGFPAVSVAIASIVGMAVTAGPAVAQVGIPAPGVPVTENFDTLVNTGTGSTTPVGWTFAEAGVNAEGTYAAGTGSSNTGNTYSFGASVSTERAFGGLLSSSLIPTIGASFQNNTTTTLTTLTISYTGEQWRLGAVGRLDRLDFQYSIDATSLTTGTWIDVDVLDFIAPVTTGTAGALDGNAAANRTALTNSIGGLTIPVGAVVWIRWSDFNASSSDDGLAVDDFSLSAEGEPIAVEQVDWEGVKALYR